MSWISAYLPDGGEQQYWQTMRQQEEQEAAFEERVKDQVAYLWDSAIDPLVADDLALHAEIGFEQIGRLLCLAAYARTKGGAVDHEYIREQLIAAFEGDIRRHAEFLAEEES